jgi:adenylate kinase family enzyme
LDEDSIENDFINIKQVIIIDVEKEILLERMKQRSRSDDNIKTINNRLDIF